MCRRVFSAPRGIGLFLGLAVIFLPAPHPRVERDAEPEIAYLCQTECEYRGITATFETLTRTYALQTYDGPRLDRWEARPNPRHPDSETLVTGIFTAAGLKLSGDAAVPRAVAEARRQAQPSFGVVWCVSRLGGFRVTAHNVYAKDALTVFQRTVDDFIARMVVLASPAELREGPGGSYAGIRHVAAGTVLLREEQRDEWSYVRIPETRVSGWLEEEHLVGVDRER